MDSPDLRDAAWGAYLAGNEKVAGAASRVVSRLRAQAASPPSARSLPLRAALLDALVRLDPEVDDDVVLPHAEGLLLPAVVVFLVGRRELDAATCLALFDRVAPGEPAWTALGNTMARRGTPGFAAALLRRLELTLCVRVWTALPRAGFEEPSGRVPYCLRSADVPIPDGWPPTALHFLEDRRYVGASLLAPGSHPIFARRVEYANGTVPCDPVGDPVASPHDCRLEWLSSWEPLPLGVAAKTFADVRWTGEQPFVREATRSRDALLGAWADSVRSLRAQGRVTAGEVPWLVPQVSLEVRDLRTRPLPALPPIPELHLSVGWRYARGSRPR